jgi:hypothetical protein
MKTKTVMFDCKHFLFQNVLIQMGLNVISVDGMLIKRVKSYVLRCFSCMKYVFEYRLKYIFLDYIGFLKKTAFRSTVVSFIFIDVRGLL